MNVKLRRCTKQVKILEVPKDKYWDLQEVAKYFENISMLYNIPFAMMNIEYIQIQKLNIPIKALKTISRNQSLEFQKIDYAVK